MWGLPKLMYSKSTAPWMAHNHYSHHCCMSTLPGLVRSNSYLLLATSNSTASTSESWGKKPMQGSRKRGGRKKKIQPEGKKSDLKNETVSEGKSKDEWWWGCTFLNGTWTDVNILLCVDCASRQSACPRQRQRAGPVSETETWDQEVTIGSSCEHSVYTSQNPEKFGLCIFAFLKILIPPPYFIKKSFKYTESWGKSLRNIDISTTNT